MCDLNEVKQRTEAELERCIEIANRLYPSRDFKMPKVDYSLKGTCAGQAFDSKYMIKMNAIICIDNEHSIEDTAAHEFAHLVDGIVYPETRFSGYRQKRSIHGPTWKRIMRDFGHAPERCHNLDVSRARVSTRRTTKVHVWKCGCGEGKVVITPAKHQRMLQVAHTGYGVYMRGHTAHRCGNYTYHGIEGQETKPVVAPVVKPTVKLTEVAAPTSPIKSKMEHCRNIFRMNPYAGRPAIIAAFINQAGCTKAGAATYYATLKKEFL
jgi:SprT protein